MQICKWTAAAIINSSIHQIITLTTRRGYVTTVAPSFATAPRRKI
jgi:hypothetical protein